VVVEDGPRDDRLTWPFDRLYSITLANRIDRPETPAVCRYSFQKTELYPPRLVENGAGRLHHRDPIALVPASWLD
jgi:hypothetical protein